MRPGAKGAVLRFAIGRRGGWHADQPNTGRIAPDDGRIIRAPGPRIGPDHTPLGVIRSDPGRPLRLPLKEGKTFQTRAGVPMVVGTTPAAVWTAVRST
jgi:hypothetical protein